MAECACVYVNVCVSTVFRKKSNYGVRRHDSLMIIYAVFSTNLKAQSSVLVDPQKYP